MKSNMTSPESFKLVKIRYTDEIPAKDYAPLADGNIKIMEINYNGDNHFG